MSLPQLALAVQSAVASCQSQGQIRDCFTYLQIIPLDLDCLGLAVMVTDFIQYNYLEEEFPQALEEVQAAVQYALAA